MPTSTDPNPTMLVPQGAIPAPMGIRSLERTVDLQLVDVGEEHGLRFRDCGEHGGGNRNADAERDRWNRDREWEDFAANLRCEIDWRCSGAKPKPTRERGKRNRGGSETGQFLYLSPVSALDDEPHRRDAHAKLFAEGPKGRASRSLIENAPHRCLRKL